MSTHLHYRHHYELYRLWTLIDDLAWSRIFWHVLLLAAVLLVMMAGSGPRPTPGVTAPAAVPEPVEEQARPEGDLWTPRELRQHFPPADNRGDRQPAIMDAV